MPPSLQAELNDHYIASYPKEAVGLLLDNGSTLRLKNWSRRHDRFLVGYWRIFRKLGWSGLRHGAGVMFIYHSHPVDAYPSTDDLDFAQRLKPRWPKVQHMIFVPGTEFFYY
jgi:proteasome lid subunit RPN8/RPN11